MSGTNVNHRSRSNIPAFPTCLCVSFRFAYANGGDESLPPAQCKIKTEISVLLYPATLITRFIPAFFTEGYQQGFSTPWTTPTSLEADLNVNPYGHGNEIGFNTEASKNFSSIDEDTYPMNESGIKSKQQEKLHSTYWYNNTVVPWNEISFPDSKAAHYSVDLCCPSKVQHAHHEKTVTW